MKINKPVLRDLIIKGISTEELNSNFDYSSVTDMSRMFYSCSSLESVPLFCTSKVKYMFHLFNNCSKLKYIDAYNYTKFDFSRSNTTQLKAKYPELFI